MLSGYEQNKTYLSFGFSVTHHPSYATNSYYTLSNINTKNIFRVGKFGMCANIFLQRFQKITHLPVNTQYPESSVNNKIKGITAEDNKDAKFCFCLLRICIKYLTLNLIYSSFNLMLGKDLMN